VVRSPGYANRKFKYEELERRGHRGRLRIDVILPVSE
jgi:hypothetical protein